MGILSLITGKPGASGFGSGSTAEQVTEGISAAGLTVLVTGGSSGIGLETSRVFALRGAHVIIAARNTEASEARKRIMEIHPLARVDVLKLDLSSLKSVRAFADQFNSMNLPLNILINNAGVMFCPFQLSEDEVEMQFATNHLGHFLLTNLLLDNMKTTAKSTGIEGRIVNLSSVAHLHTYPKGILFDQLNDKKIYNDKMAYGQSKLANILHAKELSRRLKEEGANITVNCVHPGLIMTNLMRHSFALMSNSSCHLLVLEECTPGSGNYLLRRAQPSAEGCDRQILCRLQRGEDEQACEERRLGEATLGVQRGAHQIRKMSAQKRRLSRCCQAHGTDGWLVCSSSTSSGYK
ncbi:hypothetical protein CFC21_029554 [Triticum aestivum]|uniref:Uncharacterized protein n=2 Tax=Triticum aestivum TaxID=4565 RepID=A0A9R1JFN6_WHEAT|nr:hypothetical protein CFC21_029554 [Triticum aestivum]